MIARLATWLLEPPAGLIRLWRRFLVWLDQDDVPAGKGW